MAAAAAAAALTDSCCSSKANESLKELGTIKAQEDIDVKIFYHPNEKKSMLYTLFNDKYLPVQIINSILHDGANFFDWSEVSNVLKKVSQRNASPQLCVFPNSTTDNSCGFLNISKIWV